MAILERGLAAHFVFLAWALGACHGDGTSPGASALANDDDPRAACGATSGRAGQIDTSFGTSGAARVRFGADDDGAFVGLDIVPGKIIAGGWGLGGLGGVRIRLAQLDALGAPDTSFGQNGSVLTSFAASTADAVYAVSVGHQRAGGIVAMGYREAFQAESANIALVRYTQNGALDPSFGVDGKSLIDLGGQEEIGEGLVLPDDSLLLVGRRDEDLLVARVKPGGALDTSFAAPKGYLSLRIGASSAAEGVALDSAGRILVTGATKSVATQDIFLIRANANGTIDSSFGQGGVVVVADPRPPAYAAPRWASQGSPRRRGRGRDARARHLWRRDAIVVVDAAPRMPNCAAR